MTIPITDAAWLAGFLDGEGSFQLVRYRQRQGERTYEGFLPQITAAGTEREPLKRCVAIAGGTVAGPLGANSAKGAARPWWRWTLKGTKLTPALEALIPHLTCKHEHATLLLTVRREIRLGARRGEAGRQRCDAEYARRAQLKLAISALNHRGSTQPPVEQAEALQAWRSHG